MITLDHVSFTYKGRTSPAIDDISLTIGDGEFVGVIGPGGSGKTTFTYLLNGVIPHHYDGDFYGRVLMEGMDTVTASLTDISRVAGSVFEDINAQMVASAVEDEMLFALVNFGFSAQEAESRLLGALSDVGIAGLRFRDLDTLSGGQKQKVAIAAVMALSPKVLILDGPTGELDPASSVKVYELLRRINCLKGTTVVVAEQKLGLLCAYADRLLVLDRGRIGLDGPVRGVLGDMPALSKIGIQCPPIAELYSQLRRRGLYGGDVPLTLDEAERMVREALSC
jgi:energy-coupling factor transport system ATP-binding protein